VTVLSTPKLSDVQPYWSGSGITLYHGDCLENRQWLAADVLVTDPPYGLAVGRRKGRYYPDPAERARKPRQIVVTNAIASDETTDARDAVLTAWGDRHAVVFGSWRVPRPERVRSVLIWDKQGASPGPLRAAFYTAHEEIYLLGRRPFPANGNKPRRSVIATYEARQLAVRVGHPTPKPVDLMLILLDRCPTGTVADPFAGSGSTLVAAILAGRPAIGVELEERYCELTAKRLEAVIADNDAKII
jgi:DNA modification methylase